MLEFASKATCVGDGGCQQFIHGFREAVGGTDTEVLKDTFSAVSDSLAQTFEWCLPEMPCLLIHARSIDSACGVSVGRSGKCSAQRFLQLTDAWGFGP